ncbi:MAG: polyribonucleotide nucleotidyltransferase [Candidatus Portnoybacteria bacterium CG_4_8_14_3_um_filter_44_15]|uniref:Polyribonucleotide nucleotidyltransferase n=4 Tax=Candidatus Portnoyibacteriota TaxID=1817913 RepID=A0A2M7YKQ9_9BACT|nr:MAG: polyribonucleotide nucleotidyltransferase [Parcubacteria group bacterium CG1_02_44_65]PIP15863.1 MAG: polyribonucleotide nucleotidyltransferase [Candidatus Portnoybacteria bacterium CG23_combo_of_CG06-09_8_20_14_all_44_36]PIW74686.1 MAG: polyribonucleotide nucleotidyltransferase [Candidatus Portnoybacteria bacterium CG_4_8_14_3_um_filter_44_15]PIZ70239.1 MAG: polyribonucleotide nucleotidyltransferase [Candidatus Portnoybacteria bacterium CG_4_10_14_0_2_um_filter_43_36]PJA63553.1 MAG: po
MKTKQFKTDLAGRELKVEIGQLARQANGSVLLTYGQTTVLATAVISKQAIPVDYLPLTVEYEEKFYAAGKIKGSRFIKREGRAPDEAISTGRMIDRVLRPCFDKKIRNDIQIVLTVLSFDGENDPDIPALIAASLALGVSDIPFQGPIAGLRIGRSLAKETEKKQDWILNPTYKAREESDLDLVVAGKDGKVNMLEGTAGQAPEEIILGAIEFSLPQIKKVIDFQNQIIGEVGVKKAILETEETDPKLINQVKKWIGDKIEKTIYQEGKKGRLEGLGELKIDLISVLTETEKSEDKKRKKSVQISEIFEDEIDGIVRKNILDSEKRPDGRKIDEVRKIGAQVGFLPRLHGSGLFERGETQALSVVTLGAPGDEQTIETMEIDAKKRFIHHYNFPPFCVGEARPMRGPGRREIGHGILAEKALLPLIPNKDEFPYTIRLVSEILSSNGSSSMASVSGSSLALMDAGVPIKRHISGIAMGLMMRSADEFKVLTDIQGPEDHHGDMDCKVAGTKLGMTACQMDVKIEGVTLEILKETFEQAQKARRHIIEEMDQAIGQPRPELSSYAPRIITLRINPDKIRKVIGPGGKVINEIIDETGVKIDIDDDGLVSITSNNEEAGQKALERVNDLTREVKLGEMFKGVVTRILDFGAFVKILPDQEGMVHVSEISSQRVERVEDALKVGQEVMVKVRNIDELGRINLSMKNIEQPGK